MVAHPGAFVSEFRGRKFSGSSQCRFGALGELGKGLGILNGDLCKNPPIEMNTGFFQTTDEIAVGDAVFSRRSSYSYDKQAAEFPLLRAPVPVGKSKRAINRFFRRPVQFAFGQAVSFSQTKDFFPALDSFVPSFYSWHLLTPKRICIIKYSAFF